MPAEDGMKTVLRLQSLPPSVNAMYANVAGRGRVKSERYRIWLNAEGWNLKTQHNRIHRFTVPVYVTIAIAEPKRRFDIDNRIKGILDLAVTYGVIPDDNSDWVRGVNIYIAPDKSFEGVEVAFTPAEPASSRWPEAKKDAA